MKFLLALLFVVGCASASFYDALDKASDDVLVDFLVGMEKVPSLQAYMGSAEYSDEAEEIDNDIKTELGKTLKESLDHILQKIRDAVDHGKTVSQELLEKAKEIRDKLKDIGQDAGSKAKELLERIKEKAKDWLKALLEKIGIGKRSLGDFVQNLLARLNVENLLQTLKQKIAEKIDVEAIKAYIQRVFGKTSALAKGLLETLKTKGIQAIKNLIEKILPGSLTEYSLAELWEQIKGFFKDLGVQLREKFSKFADWLKTTVKTGFENAKDKASKLKQLAKEVIDHSKTLSKEAAREALEFFEPYHTELGSLWGTLKEAIKNAIGRKE